MVLHCVIQGCYGSSEGKHRFPNPQKYPELFKRWIVIAGRPELLDRAATEVYDLARVCRKHFTQDSFGTNFTLLKTVYPTLHLPGSPSNAVDLEQHEVVHSRHEMQTYDVADSNEQGTSSETSTFDVATVTPHCKQETRKSVGVKNAKHLSPKSRYLNRKVLFYKRSVLRKRKRRIRKPSRKEVLEDAMSSMDRVRARFFQFQHENAGRQPQGHRFTLDDKILGLVLQKHCGSGYNTLSTIFDLPSRRALQRLLEKVHIKAGLNTVCFELFEKCKFANPLDRYCILMFDEMSISPHLQYNCKEDVVDGFEQFGFRTSNKIANLVQVFMLRGIYRNWKQPVYYNSVYGATSAHDIVRILKLVVGGAKKAGLEIVATVCNQRTNNILAIKNLIIETRANSLKDCAEGQDQSFCIAGMEIVPLFDVPHLFMGIRNSMLKYDLHFETNSEKKTAKWDHLYIAYKMDPHMGNVRSMPKLSDAHVDKSCIKKMKVSYCTEVLSASVAKAVNLMAYSGFSVKTSEGTLSLPHEAIKTAECCDFFDKLFDSLNGSTLYSTKQWKMAVTKDSGHSGFWNDSLKILETMFYRNGNDGPKVIPPALKNLATTTKNFKMITSKLLKIGFPKVLPRTFNLDPIDNFFEQIRQTECRYSNPTFSSFGPLYKSMLSRAITSKHSIEGNCENDNSAVFFTLHNFLHEGLPHEETNTVESFPLPERLIRSQSLLRMPILAYICDFIVKKVTSIRTCEECRSLLLADNTAGEQHILTQQNEIDDVSGLKYIDEVIFKCLSKCYSIILYILDNFLAEPNLKGRIMRTIERKVHFPVSSCSHYHQVKIKILQKLIMTLINNYIKRVNNIMHGKDLRAISKNDPLMFRRARNLYIKYKKSYQTLKP